MSKRRKFSREFKLAAVYLRAKISNTEAKQQKIVDETKSSFHFTVSGPGLLFGDVCIWNAR